jgi:UDP-glucose 4-epimerase
VKAGASLTQTTDRPASTGNRRQIVAVTGGTGFIGRRLVGLLEEAGAEVRVLTRSAPAADGSHRTVRGHLLEPAALRELVRGADGVVHLAGVAHTTLRTRGEQEHARQINVEGTRRLLDAAGEAGVSRFLLASSAHVYAGQVGVGLTEDARVSGDAPYAGMKLEAERAASEAERQGLSVAILRPCLTYGPGVRHNLQSLMRALHRGYYVQVRGAHTLRSLVSVDTVAAAFLHLLPLHQLHGAYNVADRDPVELEQWVDQLAASMGVRRPMALPRAVLQGLATIGTAASRIGLAAPLTRASLAKLTHPFSLNTNKLAATGFRWPGTRQETLQAMVAAEFPGALGAPAQRGTMLPGADA